MEVVATTAQQNLQVDKKLNLFERYLSLWVGFCMVAGVLLGKATPGLIQVLQEMEFGTESHANFSHGGPDLAHDHPDDDESGLSRRGEGRSAASRIVGHTFY